MAQDAAVYLFKTMLYNHSIFWVFQFNQFSLSDVVTLRHSGFPVYSTHIIVVAFKANTYCVFIECELGKFPEVPRNYIMWTVVRVSAKFMIDTLYVPLARYRPFGTLTDLLTTHILLLLYFIGLL